MLILPCIVLGSISPPAMELLIARIRSLREVHSFLIASILGAGLPTGFRECAIFDKSNTHKLVIRFLNSHLPDAMSGFLTDKVTRLLVDKDTDKKRQGAVEIEQKVKQMISEKKKEVQNFIISCLLVSSITIFLGCSSTHLLYSKFVPQIGTK
jgi:hypothetical protein